MCFSQSENIISRKNLKTKIPCSKISIKITSNNTHVKQISIKVLQQKMLHIGKLIYVQRLIQKFILDIRRWISVASIFRAKDFSNCLKNILKFSLISITDVEISLEQLLTILFCNAYKM